MVSEFAHPFVAVKGAPTASLQETEEVVVASHGTSDLITVVNDNSIFLSSVRSASKQSSTPLALILPS